MRIEGEAKKELRPGHGKKEGTLQRSITTRRAQRQGNKIIGAVGTNIKYALFVHRGTGLYGPKRKKYRIAPRNKKALRFKVGGETVIVKSVNHPGIKPIPFFTIAFNKVSPQFKSILARHVRDAGNAEK